MNKRDYEYMKEWLKETKNFRESKITEIQYEEWKYSFPKYSTLNHDKLPREQWLHKKSQKD